MQVVSHVNHVSIYAGAYPSPQLVRQYEQAAPGFNERVADNTSRAMEIEHRERMISMAFGLVGTLAALSLVAFCVAHGERVIAGLVVSTMGLGVLRLYLGRGIGKDR